MLSLLASLAPSTASLLREQKSCAMKGSISVFVCTVVALISVVDGGMNLTSMNTQSGAYLDASSPTSWTPRQTPVAGDTLIIDLSSSGCTNQDAFVFPFGWNSPKFASVTIRNTVGMDHCLTLVYVVGTLKTNTLIVGADTTLVLGSPLQNVLSTVLPKLNSAKGIVGRIESDSMTLAEGSFLQGNGVIEATTGLSLDGGVVVPGRRLNRTCPLCHPLFASPNTNGLIRFENAGVSAILRNFVTFALFGDSSSQTFDIVQFTGNVAVAVGGTLRVFFDAGVVPSQALQFGGQLQVQASAVSWPNISACHCGFPWEGKCSSSCPCIPCPIIPPISCPGCNPSLFGTVVNGVSLQQGSFGSVCVGGIVDPMTGQCVCHGAGSEFTWSDPTCSTPVCSPSCATLCEAASPVPVCNPNAPAFSCITSPCRNGGRCISGTQCQCPPEWAGQTCEVSTVRGSPSGLSNGAMAGVILGGLVGCLIVFVVVLLAVRAHRHRSVARAVKQSYLQEMEMTSPYKPMN